MFIEFNKCVSFSYLVAMTTAFLAPISRSLITESFVFEGREYVFCNLEVSWDEALVICPTFDAELARFENNRRENFIGRAIAESSIDTAEIWVGEIWDSGSNSKWIASKQRWVQELREPRGISKWNRKYSSKNEHCSAVTRKSHRVPVFLRLPCDQQRPFICQREHLRSGEPVRVEPTVEVGDEEFTVFLGRVRWSDAVTYCREQKLAIAEVRNLVEAQVLSMVMLRARPNGMESAWIGGYAKDSAWHWIVSGDLIEESELWSDPSRSSGGCLMIDRHLNEPPGYVATRCYRNRDFICQKRRAPLLRTSLAPKIIDGWKYWLGSDALQWKDARDACSSLNATLLVLQSPTSIVHVKRILAESTLSIRHIWTDGRREESLATIDHGLKPGRWVWDSSQEEIPDPRHGFLVWVEDIRYIPDADCLNLDPGIQNTSVVYGLACGTRQPYICQTEILADDEDVFGKTIQLESPTENWRLSNGRRTILSNESTKIDPSKRIFDSISQTSPRGDETSSRSKELGPMITNDGVKSSDEDPEQHDGASSTTGEYEEASVEGVGQDGGPVEDEMADYVIVLPMRG